MAMSTKTVAILFLCLLAGNEAARISAAAARQASDFKDPRLDWRKCGSRTGPLGMGCSSLEGCSWHSMWLDTPRQSCRVADEYKLAREHMATFLPVELARLEAKTLKFSQKGCLMGGWMMKCYRRTLQILRLSNYIRKALEQARADPAHPAYEAATSQASIDSLERVALNLGQGFAKGSPFEFTTAFERMKNVQEELGEARKQAAASGATLPAEDQGNAEKAATVAAMVKMLGVDATEAQRANLFARVEAEAGSDEVDTDTVFEEQVSALEAMVNDADGDDRASVASQEGTSDDAGEGDDEEEAAEDEAAALVEVGGRSAEAGALASRGTGPLKWLFKHGLGWLVARVAWLLLFSMGAALGLVRGAVVFPLVFALCVLKRFVSWALVDVGYNFMWEGEVDALVGGLREIGKCGPEMWDFVGFDAYVESPASQIVVQPALFASKLTGVRHAFKSEASLCSKVDCGPYATCQGGQCFCKLGYAPDTLGACGPVVTAAGCVCKSFWTESHFFATITTGHYGCPSSKYQCQVDTTHPSYSKCQGGLRRVVGGARQLVSQLVSGGGTPLTDSCSPTARNAQVNPASIAK